MSKRRMDDVVRLKNIEEHPFLLSASLLISHLRPVLVALGLTLLVQVLLTTTHSFTATFYCTK